MKISRNRYSYFAMLAIIGFVFLTGADSCLPERPSCIPEAIPINSLLSPVGRLVSGENIFVEWSFDGDNTQCQPDLYEIRFHEAAYPQAAPRFIEFTDDTFFYADYLFNDNTEFIWRIRGYSGTDSPPSEWSDAASFIILPICPAHEMGQITPIYPVDNSRIQSSSVVFQIDTNLLDCIPPTYHLQVSNIETMDDLLFNEDLSYLSLQEEIQLDPCHDYYWRVAGSESGIDGPLSEIFHFTIQNEECGSDPHAAAAVDTPCRIGPGNEYDLGRYFLKGDEAPIVAKDPFGEWLRIETANLICWVLREHTTSTGNTDDLPVHLPPIMDHSNDDSNDLRCKNNLPKSMCEETGGTYFERLTPPCVCP